MSSSADVVERYLKRLHFLSPHQRVAIYAEIADQYGAGFARLVREERDRRDRKDGSQA